MCPEPGESTIKDKRAGTEGDSEDCVDCDRCGATGLAAAIDRVCGVCTSYIVIQTERRRSCLVYR